MPEEKKDIETVADLIYILSLFEPDLKLDVHYDSGYGKGDFSPDTIYRKDGKLYIEV